VNLPDIIAQLRGQIAAKLEERNAIAAELEQLRDAETTDQVAVDEKRAAKAAIDADIDAISARVADLEAEHARDEAASRLQTEVHPTGANRAATAQTQIRVGQEARTYSPASEREGVSFLRDVMNAQTRGDFVAAERLGRHMAEERVERAGALAGIQSRDVGTGAFTGLTVPQYLTDLVAPEIKAMRPFADICRKHPLPADGMTVNISRITTSSAAAIQATEGAGVQETDMDDTLLTVNVRTIAGQQDVSRQAIDRGTGIDQIVIQDLIGEYHTTLDSSILNDDGTSGTHLGVRNVSGNVAVTYTDGDPTAAELYPKLADLVQQIQAATNNGLSHFVMHPRRWWWIASQLASTSPLLTVPMAGNQQAGTLGDTSYAAGGASILGARVILDRNIPTNTGAGTVDPILGVDASECHLWEDSAAPLLIRAEQTGAGNLLVKFVVYGYSAFTAGRYPLATGDITGTGLAAPTF
jgi:HK97 family phage major capsid protein